MKTMEDNSKPLVSVIIPVYKVEKYLSKCIDSILAQTYTKFELILVDDGSPDACPEICDCYALFDSRINVIHQKNAGVSTARNLGLDCAKGKYVYFCDSDDYVHRDLLRIAIEYMEQGLDALVFQMLKVDENGNAVSTFTWAPYETDSKNEKKEHFFLHALLNDKISWSMCAWMYRREIIENHHIRFKKELVFAEDLYFALCYCFYADRVKQIDTILYFYFQRSDSFMGREKHKGNLNRLSIMGEYVSEFWENQPNNEDLMRVYPLIFYSILNPEINRIRKDNSFTIPEMRQYIYETVTNISFFMRNIQRLSPMIYQLPCTGENTRPFCRKCEIDYWNDNNYLKYCVKVTLYQIYAGMIRFIKKLFAFARYRTGMVFAKVRRE